MNCEKPSLAKTEIIKQLGYFPAFLSSAVEHSMIYRSLTQQTLLSYINNPLPSKFKEKLFISLSRYYGISYFTICHSCTLRSLGVSISEILELENLGYPGSEAEVATDIQNLSEQCSGKDWHHNPKFEAALLRCSSLIFINPEQRASLSSSLKKLLGTVYYHYLILLLGYIKLCHQWLRSNQSISHQQDRRSQLHLGSMLLEESKLAAFLQADAPFPIMIHNQLGEIVYLNPNWSKATGYTAELSTLSEWHDKAQIQQRIDRLPAKSPQKLYQKHVAPAHQTAIETTAALQEIICSLLDVAPDSAIKSQVFAYDTVQSLAKLTTVINLLPHYLFVVDIQSRAISLVNSELVKSLFVIDSEVIGKQIADCFAPEYVSQINWQHQQAITSKQVLHVQEEVILSDGIHYLDTVVTPLYNSQGEIYALLHTSSEIPNLAATQEALSQRTLQLEAANRELESFSYSVSHDLQAPLRIINGFSQVLKENYQADLDDRGRHYLQRIQANSQLMSNLIDALLELSRVTSSQMKSIKVDLRAIAIDIVKDLQAENPQRKIKVIIASGLETTGDPRLLRIVLNNLLHNAWKYTSKRSHSKIEFGALTQNDERQTFFVRDNGAGFDQEYAEKLFTAFQRFHTQAEFPGTGIGLATVQRIIYRHGGKVWAQGECDRGATIYFSL